VYALGLLVLDVVIFLLLKQLSGPLAMMFLIFAAVSIPAVVIYRREAAYAPQIGPESESTARGWLRLLGDLSLDITGITIGVLIIVLLALFLRAV
jgi:hypothetical protein